MTKDQAIDKARKLIALAESEHDLGHTPAAEAAHAKAVSLLAPHGLTEADIATPSPAAQRHSGWQRAPNPPRTHKPRVKRQPQSYSVQITEGADGLLIEINGQRLTLAELKRLGREQLPPITVWALNLMHPGIFD